MLEIVEDQQQLPVMQPPHDRVQPIRRTAWPNPQHARDGRDHLVYRGGERERHEAASVAMGRRFGTARRDREPRLPDPTGPKEGHEPASRPRQELGDLFELVLPPDQGRPLLQEAARALHVAGRCRRRRRGPLAEPDPVVKVHGLGLGLDAKLLL